MAKKIRTLFLICIVAFLILTCKKIKTDQPYLQQTEQRTGEQQVDPGAKTTAATNRYAASLTLDDKNYILGANPMGQTFCSASSRNEDPPYAGSTYFEVSLLKLVNGVYIANGDKAYWRIYNTHWPPDLDKLNYLANFNLLLGADNNYSTLNLYQLLSDPCQLRFTEYGTSAGEYISGSIGGRLYHRIENNTPPLDTLNPHNIIFNFRVLKL